MRIIERSAAILALFLAITGRAHAQDSTQVWSLGVDNQSGIYVGIALSPRFRLEPEVGLVRQHDKAVFTFDNGFGGTTTVNEDVTAASYRVGVGLLWQWQRVAHVRLYAGPRAGIMVVRAKERISGGQTGEASARRTDWFAGVSLGAEYFPAERLSAGADVQLRGIAQGSPSQQSSGATSVGVFTPSEPTLSTRGLLTVRFYL